MTSRQPQIQSSQPVEEACGADRTQIEDPGGQEAEAGQGRSQARPSLALQPRYCALVIELGGGKIKAQMASKIDVARSTLDAWMAEREEFRDAYARAMDFALAYREGVDEKGNACRRSLQRPRHGGQSSAAGSPKSTRTRNS